MILLAIQALKTPPFRVMGIQLTCFTLAELFMQYALVESNRAAPFLVLLTFLIAFGALIVLQCHFYDSDESLSEERREESMAAPLCSPSASESDIDSDPHVPSPAERRTALAESHGLSQRETDVFLLLAQGRSRKFICEELYIADGTASSYIGRVYEKFGVHSKQELLSLVLEQEDESA